MKTKDLILYLPFFYDSARDPREPSPCQSPPAESATMSPGDEYVLPFLKKMIKKLAGESAHALFRCTANHQICRMALLKWYEYMCLLRQSVQSNQMK